MSVYRAIDLVESTPISWEDAVRDAIDSSTQFLWSLRIAEVKELDVNLYENGRIGAYRAKIRVSFKYDNWKRGMGWKT